MAHGRSRKRKTPDWKAWLVQITVSVLSGLILEGLKLAIKALTKLIR